MGVMPGITIGKLSYREERASHAHRSAHDQEGPCSCQVPLFQDSLPRSDLLCSFLLEQSSPHFTEPGGPDVLFPLLALGFGLDNLGEEKC